MKYYEEPERWKPLYGQIYKCNHPLYDRCTLYLEKDIGIAVIQQRFSNKRTYWDYIDPWLANDIYLNENFPKFFKKHATKADKGLYPTICVRQIMRALGIPPLRKEFWETRF